MHSNDKPEQRCKGIFLARLQHQLTAHMPHNALTRLTTQAHAERFLSGKARLISGLRYMVVNSQYLQHPARQRMPTRP
jgi:hypothetical protein